MPESGTQEANEGDLQMKLQGNPEVDKGRNVMLLEFADVCIKNKLFKKESNLKIIQKPLNLKGKED